MEKSLNSRESQAVRTGTGPLSGNGAGDVRACGQQNLHLARLIDHLPGMAYRYARDGNGGWTMAFVSEGCLALTGYCSEDLTREQEVAYTQLIHPDDRDAVWSQIRTALQDGGDFDCAYRLLLGNKGIKWVRDQGAGVFSEAGELLLWEGYVSDVSEAKQRTGILIRSDEQAVQLIQSIQDGVCLICGEDVQFANAPLAEMMGYTVADMEGRKYRSFIVPDAWTETFTYYRRMRAGDETSARFETRLLHKDGVTQIPVIITSTMITYRGSGILAIIKDVSEHWRVEQERVQLSVRVDKQRQAIIQLSTHPSVAEGQLDAALPVIAKVAAHTLQVERVGIWRLDSGEGEHRCLLNFSVSEEQSSHQSGLRVADYPAYFTALQSGLVLDVADVQTDPRTAELTKTYWNPMGITSSIEAPIRVHGQVVGVVCHEHLGTRRDWKADEVAFASQIADLVAQVFLNADLRRRADELAAITRVSREISANLNLQQVLDSIARHAVQLSGTDLSIVFALRQDGSLVLASHGLSEVSRQVIRDAGDEFLRDAAVARALLEQRPIQVYDALSEKSPPLRDVLVREDIHSELVVPMVKGTEIIGGIILCHRQPRHFTPEEVAFTQALAQQSVNAVENARLLELERSIRRRAEALYRLARSLITFDNLPALLQAVVDGVEETLNVSWAALVTLDAEKRQVVEFAYSEVEGSPNTCPLFETFWAGLIGEVWRTGVPVVMPSIPTDFPIEECTNLQYADVGSLLVAPLQYQGEMIGTLVAVRSSDQPALTEQDAALLSAMANQTATVVKSYRLLASLGQEKTRLEMLYRLGHYLSGSLDIHTVCRLAMEEICTALGVLKGLIFTHNSETSTMQLLAHYGFYNDQAAVLQERQFEIGEGLSGWVMLRGETAVVDDLTGDLRWVAIPGGDDDVRSALSVPLFSGDELVGVMTLSSVHREFFTREHCRLVESAAATIAIAVYNARLFSSAQHRAREQGCVSDIARALNALTVERAFPVLVKSLHQFAACDRVILASRDDVQRTFQVVESTEADVPGGQILPIPDAVEALLMAGQPHLAVDLDVHHDNSADMALHKAGMRSRLVLPLLIGRQVIGLLCLGSRMQLTQSHIATLQQVADTVAIALENDRLFRAEQRQREVAERLQETALVVSTLDLQEVLKLIMDQLESIFPYQSGSIQILEHDAMRVIAARNRSHDAIGRRYPLDAYLYHRRLADGEVIVVPDVLEDNEVGVCCDEDSRIRSNIGVPLWVRDKVIGALTIGYREARAYSEEDIRVIRVFAQQAAIAIENARLYEAQRAQRELAEALEEAAAVVSSALDFDQVLDYILDQVARVVHADTFNIILVDGDKGRMIRWRGYDELGIPSSPESRENVPIHYPSLLRMLHDGQPTVVPDVSKDPNWVAVPGREILNSYVAAPIRIAGKTEGFLNVASVHPNQFGSQDAQRLKAFADHAAIALQNARLFQRTLQYTEELERRVRDRTVQLEAKNAWLEAIVSSTSDGIVVTDSDGHIVDANRVAKMWLYHSLPSEDVERLRETVRGLARRAEARPDAVIELSGLDLELRAAPILERGAEGPAVVVAVHDVSYLKALDRMKSQFISNVSHELRTPITSIRLYSSLIQRSPASRRAQYFEALDQEAARLSKLVEDILQISRIEAGQLELERQRIDLNTLSETAVISHRALAESKGLTLVYRSDVTATMISADSDKFIQVLNNLIENAIKYTLEGGHIAVSIERRTRDARGWALVVVRDTGIGIPDAEKACLFDRFFRGAEPEEMRIQGSGLGLAIVKEIVELHGGSVAVDSQVGVGSTFAVWIPLIEAI